MRALRVTESMSLTKPRQSTGSCPASAPLCLLMIMTLVMFVSSGSANELPDPIVFYADLSADEQSSTTISPGSGRVDFFLERATQRFSWVVRFQDLTTRPIGAAVHGPQRPGTNAGVQFALAPESGLSNLPLQGSVVLTDAQIEYLLSGRMYVNIRTLRYPEGELRGQIERQPPR